jgi:hypothetical protein
MIVFAILVLKNVNLKLINVLVVKINKNVYLNKHIIVFVFKKKIYNNQNTVKVQIINVYVLN